MHKNIITKLLGIQDNSVKKVEINEDCINIYVQTKPSLQKCPCCGYYTKRVHDYRKQKIKHINVNSVQSFIYLEKRRYICKHCGKKFYEHYDFIQKYFRNSNDVFWKIISDFKQIKNFKTIAQDNNVSIPTVITYAKYAVFFSGNNKVTLPKRLGIDEFKGNCDKIKYQVQLSDLDTGKVLDIIKARDFDTLEAYFSSFSPKERRNVQYVSMDLYSPFKRIIKDTFLSATIVADRFHYTKLVISALDELRLNLWRKAKGHDKFYFKSISRILAKDSSKLKPKQYERLLHAFEFCPTLKYAYTLKERFINIKNINDFDIQEKAFRKWLEDAESSTINEFKHVVKTLRQWHEYISNSFMFNISNGPIEGKNNLIKTFKRISFGFKKLENLKNRILLFES